MSATSSKLPNTFGEFSIVNTAALHDQITQSQLKKLRASFQRLDKYITFDVSNKLNSNRCISFSDLLNYSKWRLDNDLKSAEIDYWDNMLLLSLNSIRNGFSDVYLRLRAPLDNAITLLTIIDKDSPIRHTFLIMKGTLSTALSNACGTRVESCSTPLPDIESAHGAATLDAIEELINNYTSFFEWMESNFIPELNKSLTKWAQNQYVQLNAYKLSLADTALLDPVILEKCESLLNPDRMHEFSLDELYTVEALVQLLKVQNIFIQEPRFLEACSRIFEEQDSSEDVTNLYPTREDYLELTQFHYGIARARVHFLHELWSRYNQSHTNRFTEGTPQHTTYKIAQTTLLVECAFIEAIENGDKSIDTDINNILGAYRSVNGAETLSQDLLILALQRAYNFHGLSYIYEEKFVPYISDKTAINEDPFKTAPTVNLHSKKDFRRDVSILSNFKKNIPFKIPLETHQLKKFDEFIANKS